MDALILGAGIIGLAIARELAGRGRRVTVLEQRLPGAGASGAAAGMLAPQAEWKQPGPLLEMGLASRDLYPAWIESIMQGGGEDPEYDPAGTVAVGCSAEEGDALEEQAAWQKSHDLPHRLLTLAELRAVLPGITDQATIGLHLPRDHRVDPRRLCRALASAVVADGVQIETRVQVSGFIHEGGRVSGVRLGDRELQAPVIIAAAGCWTGMLPATEEGGWPDVPPVRGQMIVLEPQSGSCLRDGEGCPSVVSGHGYAVPRRAGLVLFGSTMENAGYQALPTAGGVSDLTERAARLFPGLAGARLETSWAGLRPGSADGLPTIGVWRNTGVILATGHHRNGILLAPATGRAVADLVEGSEPEWDLGPFSPGR